MQLLTVVPDLVTFVVHLVDGPPADEDVKAATLRLHAKGLITQADGGYLTRLGREAAEHAQAMLGILTAGVAASVTSPSPPET